MSSFAKQEDMLFKSEFESMKEIFFFSVKLEANKELI
jgi:hypothetical protein